VFSLLPNPVSGLGKDKSLFMPPDVVQSAGLHGQSNYSLLPNPVSGLGKGECLLTVAPETGAEWNPTFS